MSAIIAARRLGCETVDIQHGLQGAGHFGYSNWHRKPEKGVWECMPDHYWFWGENDIRNFSGSNNFKVSEGLCLVGGYPWLNRWKETNSESLFRRSIEAARNLKAGYENVYLVTLQRDVEFRNILLPLIKQSADNVLWLVRLHPAMLSQQDEICRELEKAGNQNTGVDVLNATSLPLYSLFRISDWHLTWWSTCANEALSFGVPSILLHQNGQDAFSFQINEGAMYFEIEPEKILSLLSTPGPSKSLLENVATNYFAGSEAMKKSLELLLKKSGVSE